MKVYDVLPDLTKVIRQEHIDAGIERGHGFGSHVYRVASLAYLFGAELGVAVKAAAARPRP